MEVLYLLIPLGLALVVVVVAVLWWAVQAGQFEDIEGAGTAILMDDDAPDRGDATLPSARPGPEA